MNFILIYTKPNSILELGSGRSTFYLYEYAIGYEKKLNSIEHNYKFYRYIKKNLKSIFNNEYDFVTFAPIKKIGMKLKIFLIILIFYSLMDQIKNHLLRIINLLEILINQLIFSKIRYMIVKLS